MMEYLRYRLALAVVLALPSAAAMAQDPSCPSGQSDKLELVAWSADPGRNGPTVTFSVHSNLNKATRSISATLIFFDKQGMRLAEMPLSPDLRIRPGTTGSDDDVIADAAMNEVLKPDRISALICMRYVEYSDGGFEEF